MKNTKKIVLSACILSILSLNPIQAATETRVKNIGGKCLDVNGPDLGKTGGKVQIWECNQAVNQQWIFDAQGRIHNQGGKCLDVSGDDLNKNAGKVQLWDCNDAPNQKWSFDNRQRLHNAGGKCLDILGPELHKNGGKIQIWDCNDAPNQQWKRETEAPKVAERPQPTSTFINQALSTPKNKPSITPAPIKSGAVNPFVQAQRRAELARDQQQQQAVIAQQQTIQRQTIKPTIPVATPPVVTNVVTNTTPAPAPFTGMISLHNKARAEVGVPPIKWSNTVAKVSQAWADELKAKQNCNLQHSSSHRYGENLGGGSGRLTSRLIVGLWEAEKQDYTYANNRCTAGKVCGHYTQMVWKRSTEMGCGAASCGSMTVWVCNYNPPGNYIGQKPY